MKAFGSISIRTIRSAKQLPFERDVLRAELFEKSGNREIDGMIIFKIDLK
jgi:hypothetical protein